VIWPVRPPPDSLPAGYRFGAPRPYRSGVHQGVDLGKMGDPVYAAESGEVTFAGQSSGYGGLMVYIKHAGGWQTRYMHLKSGSILVKKGQQVRAGQQIASVGRTGIERASAHLHFETLKDGKKIDPESVLRGGGMMVALALAGVAWVIYKVVA
jgi:murein DD-endopeptidase MepM/ murein hydrolase activator NlpD